MLQRAFPLSGEGRTPFVALGSSRGLRWILPSQEPRIARLLGTWRPYKLSSRLGWQAIQWAVHGGFLSRLPGVERFEADISATDWRRFGWEGTAPPLMAFYVGTPGPQRKLATILADPRTGEPLFVVKLPLGETAWPAIAREYESLRELRAEGRARVPSPILIDHERRFAVQSWIDGRPTRVGVSPAHIAFLVSLAQPGKTIALESVRAELLEERARLMEEGALSSETAAETERLLSGGDWRGEAPAVRIHGDFAPWNLKRRQDGTVSAIDWEESEAEGLPFYDLCYYRQQTERLLGRRVAVPWRAYQEALIKRKGPDMDCLETASRATEARALLAV